MYKKDTYKNLSRQILLSGSVILIVNYFLKKLFLLSFAEGSYIFTHLLIILDKT